MMKDHQEIFDHLRKQRAEIKEQLSRLREEEKLALNQLDRIERLIQPFGEIFGPKPEPMPLDGREHVLHAQERRT